MTRNQNLETRSQRKNSEQLRDEENDETTIVINYLDVELEDVIADGQDEEEGDKKYQSVTVVMSFLQSFFQLFFNRCIIHDIVKWKFIRKILKVTAIVPEISKKQKSLKSW